MPPKVYVNKYDNNCFYVVINDETIVKVPFNGLKYNKFQLLWSAKRINELPPDVTDGFSKSPYTCIQPINPQAGNVLPEIKYLAGKEMQKMHDTDCEPDMCFCEGFKLLSEMDI